MLILRQRRQIIRDIHSDRFERQRLSEVAQERCGLCWDPLPSSVMTTEDGRRRCPDCVDTTTSEWKTRIEEHDAERIATRQTRPQISQAPLRESVPPHIRIMENASGTRVTQGSPLGLVRSGPSVDLILKGGGFAAGDTFTYSTGITAATALSGTTQWTLTLSASSETTPGDNHLTFNSHTYRGIFRVG